MTEPTGQLGDSDDLDEEDTPLETALAVAAAIIGAAAAFIRMTCFN